MEIYRGNKGNDAKIYESEYFVNDPNHEFESIYITDGRLCGGDPNLNITIKFICRN
jgi:hypothetical protein